MSLYSTAVKRPITTLVVFVAVLAIGLFSLRKMPIDLYPDIEPPVISIFTMYPGAGAMDIETNVTRVLEDALSTVSNLKDMSSVSRDNISTITLEFEWESNLDEAVNEIRDIIGRIDRLLPEDVEQPTIFKFSSSMIPVMVMSATAEESYAALAKIIDDAIVNPLNRVDGVGAVTIFGQPIREIQINVDPQRLESFNISLEQIGNVLRAENINLPTGNIKTGKTESSVRFTAEFSDSRNLPHLLIGNAGGKPVYLKDVASVKDTLRESTIEEMMNSRQGLRFMVQKQSGANTVSIAHEVNKLLPKLQKNLPPDVVITPVFDTSVFIVDAINNLTDVLYYAALFVALVVLFFIGRWRATLIIIITIPVSLITGFIYLYFTGNTLNMISLSSLAIAMGMVVDDAIVVLENINKHIQRGSYPKEAAIYGTNEVGMAVVASTLTVVAVFLPMTLIGGLMGLFFRQLGFIVSITVTVSTIAALSLTPMLSSVLMDSKKVKKTKLGIGIASFVDGTLDRLDNAYSKLLSWSLRRKTMVIIISAALFIGSLFLLPSIGTEFMPASDNSRLTARIELPTGLNLEETSKTSRKIESIIYEKYPEVVRLSTSTGYSSTGGMFGGNQTGTNVINFTLALSSPRERERDMFLIADLLRNDLKEIPEIVKFNVESGGGGGMGGKPVEVQIFGNDLEQTSAFAATLAERMKGIEGVRDIEISRGEEKPELRIIPDQEKMAMFGLNTAIASQAIRNRIEGYTATKFREDGQEYDIVVRYDEPYRSSVEDIENILVTNPMGQKIRVKEFASVEQYYAPPNIERKNRVRYVAVTSSLYKRALGMVTADIEKVITDIGLPAGVDYRFGGQIQNQQEAFADLGLLLLLSIFLVFIVMAAQFESFFTPFIIMFSIPFAFTGVLLALFFSGATLNVISIIGAVILVGIAVKNAIVLIDYTNLLRNRGESIIDAVVNAGKSRLRPVLMTTLTTILAMMPLAFSRGEGSEIWQPMAMAVLGGLTVSTLVTLVFIPVIYVVFSGRKAQRTKKALTA